MVAQKHQTITAGNRLSPEILEKYCTAAACPHSCSLDLRPGIRILPRLLQVTRTMLSSIKCTECIQKQLPDSTQFPAFALLTFARAFIGLVTLYFLHLSSFQALNRVSGSNSLKMKTFVCWRLMLALEALQPGVTKSSNKTFSQFIFHLFIHVG